MIWLRTMIPWSSTATVGTDAIESGHGSGEKRIAGTPIHRKGMRQTLSTPVVGPVIWTHPVPVSGSPPAGPS